MSSRSRRRYLGIIALAVASIALAACGSLDTAKALLTRQVALTAPQLQAYLDRRPPKRYDQLGGLIGLTVMNPRISIPQNSTRLHMDFDVGVDGLGMKSDRPAGHFAVTSGLRFDPDRQALFLEEPRLESAELPWLGGRMNDNGRSLIDGWLRDYARSEPVYRLDAEQVETLGTYRIAGTLIQNGRVVIKLDR